MSIRTRTTATIARTLACVVVLASVAGAAPRRKPAPKAPAPAPAPSAPVKADDTLGIPTTPAPGPSGAPTEHRRMVGILDVRVDGVPDEIKAAFERGLEEQLDTQIYWLSTREQMRDRMKFSTRWTEGCLVGACLEELRAQTTAEIVLLAAFNGSGTSFGHVVTLVRTDNGRVLSQKAGRCEVCTVNEAMAEATLATMGLLNAVPDVLPPDETRLPAAVAGDGVATARAVAAARRGARRRGIALTVIGLAVTGAGIATYFLNDKPDYAVAVAAGGGGLTLGGVMVLSF